MTDTSASRFLPAILAGRIRRNWRVMAWHGERADRPPSAGAGRLAAMILGSAALIVFVGLLYDTRLLAMMETPYPPVQAFFGWLTRFGKSDWLLIPSGALVIVVALGDWRQVSPRRAAVWAEIAAFATVLFLVVAASGLLTDLIKPIVGRLRPPFVDDSAMEFLPLAFTGYRNYSFPSGHATTAGAMAVIMAVGPYRWRFVGVALAVLVAMSRFFIGVHFASDIVAGWLVGGGVAWLIVRAMAYGGFGFRRDAAGRITWRFGVFNRLRREGGWFAGLLPPLWRALKLGPAG